MPMTMPMTMPMMMPLTMLTKQALTLPTTTIPTSSTKPRFFWAKVILHHQTSSVLPEVCASEQIPHTGGIQ
jgi:hypothetical protein